MIRIFLSAIKLKSDWFISWFRHMFSIWLSYYILRICARNIRILNFVIICLLYFSKTAENQPMLPWFNWTHICMYWVCEYEIKVTENMDNVSMKTILCVYSWFVSYKVLKTRDVFRPEFRDIFIKKTYLKWKLKTFGLQFETHMR